MRFSIAPLLSVAALALLALKASAADPTTALPNLSSAAASESAAESSASASSASATDSNTAQTTDAPTGSSIQSSSVIITGSGSTGTASGSVPTITGTSSGSSDAGLPTNLPSLTGGFTIPTPSVPPTAGAPYMQVSHLPEGTVFIIVGAILGFFALCIMLWRGLVAWSLHRSVRRAAMRSDMSDTKALFRTSAAPMYSYKDRESSISLAGLGPKSGKKGPKPAPSAGSPAPSSLFYSPTAGAAGGGMAAPGNRGSNYLPAGYYAATASQPGNGQGLAHVGGNQSISLSNLGPMRDGYARARSIGPSPDQSPQFRAHQPATSMSTLNLHQAPGDRRTPSTYLDDLFDSEGAPPAPGHMVGGGARF